MGVYSRSTVYPATVAAIHLAPFLLPMRNARWMATVGPITALCVASRANLLVAPTALTAKDDLVDIDNNDDSEL